MHRSTATSVRVARHNRVLEVNGVEITDADNHDVFDLVIDVASTGLTIDQTSERLQRRARSQ